MKKFVSLAMASILAISTLAGCGSKEEAAPAAEGGAAGGTEAAAPAEVLKVAMTTDSGTIDDKSFNQGTWEGILKYEEENAGAIETHYVKPTGEAEADYLNAYADLVDAGYQVIFSPGFKFETAVYKAQELYPDVKFVILDGYPHNGDYNADVKENTESIFFAEHESGFYAGIASALQSKTGKLGFIGGMEIPAVQKFGWGFVSGVAYANKTYGTNAQVTQYIYQGTFNDVAAGQTLAGAFYNDGVDVVFHAAGGVGVGVINEGKTRRTAGEDVWVVGVDVDQYAEGIMEDGTSAILTSAQKDLGNAAYNTIQEIIDGQFKAGQTIVLDSSNGGVGLPAENPNLTAETIAKYEETFAKVAAGEIAVPASVEDLQAFLTTYGYTSASGVSY